MSVRLTPAVFVLSVAGLAISLAACSNEHQTAARSPEDQPAVEPRSYEDPQPIQEAKSYEEPQPVMKADARLQDWPADAVPGECYAKAYIPPATQTVSEQVCKREQCERLEIVPAQYEWVEERVMTKDASFALTEVPAEFKTEQVTMEVRPSETGWFVNSGGCRTNDGKTMNNVFCYVTRPPETKTVSKQVMSKCATLDRVEIPAEYTTIKRQKLVAEATTRKTSLPAEFETVSRTVVTAPAHWEWQRVICDHDPVTMNEIKRALIAHGYQAGPMNGEMTEQDWSSVRAFQLANGLGVGNLSHETLQRLQVSTAK